MEYQHLRLYHLYYFTVVVEEGSFTQAAERLRCTQPAVTQNIQTLEEVLDLQLFDREQRPLQLTMAGRILLEEVYELSNRFKQVVNLARQASRGETGRLIVGFTSSVANSFLPWMIMRTYRQRFPKVKLLWRELASYQQIQNLRDQQIDVGFFHMPSSLGSVINYCAKAVYVISFLLEEASEGSLNVDYELRVVVEKVAVSSQEVVKRDTIKAYDIKRPESIATIPYEFKNTALRNPDCDWQSFPTITSAFDTNIHPDLAKLQCEQGARYSYREAQSNLATGESATSGPPPSPDCG